MNRAVVFMFLACTAAYGQDAALTFDVASVKPAAPQGPGRRMIRMQGGPGTGDPERINHQGVSLMMLLTNAYDVKNFQINGPDWLDSERFDVTAKVPKGTTKEQARVMMQNLLKERFHLALHKETKETQGYELVVAKNGPKFKETAFPEAEDMPRPAPSKMDDKGPPKMEGRGMRMMMMMGPKGPAAKVEAQGQPLSELTQMLGNQLKKPIVDKTGLTGKYDFVLEYAPDMAGMGKGPMGPGPGDGGAPPAGPEESGPDLVTAMREQLGLRLDSKKLPVDLLVIDKVDRVPVEN